VNAISDKAKKTLEQMHLRGKVVSLPRSRNEHGDGSRSSGRKRGRLDDKAGGDDV